MKKLYPLFLVYGIIAIVVVIFLQSFLSLDKTILIFISTLRTSSLDVLFVSITQLGSNLFLIILIIYTFFKNRKVSAYLILAFIIDTILIVVLKYSFMRPRPEQSLAIAPVNDVNIFGNIGNSFPSGHSQRIVSTSVILGTFYKHLRIPLIALSILVPLSRVYMGAHYPLDVVFGVMNGIIVGFVCLGLPIKKLKSYLDRAHKKLTS